MPPQTFECMQQSHDCLNKTNEQNAAANNLRAQPKLDASKVHPKELAIVWKNVYVFSFLHLAAVYGVYCCFYAKPMTLLFAFTLYVYSGLGITAGAHRLWAHRTYKAKLPLRIFLGIAQTLALQNSIFEWSRDHRAHHKHSETHADPHNAKRGFFFAHMGWLLMRKHPLVFEKGSKIPMDDLLADPVVYYQRKFYKPLAVLVCFILPTIIPYLLWDETLINGYFVPAVLRYILTLHATWFVNSVAHMWGMKPYDKTINPVENILVSIGAHGEGFHNYHHTFPQDYATSEYGSGHFNISKAFIDLNAFFGLAYARNKISKEMILQRRKRTGDLSTIVCPPPEAQEDHDYDY